MLVTWKSIILTVGLQIHVKEGKKKKKKQLAYKRDYFDTIINYQFSKNLIRMLEKCEFNYLTIIY